MKKTTKTKQPKITFKEYLENWYQNEYLPTSTSSSTDSYYHWMIFNIILPSLNNPDISIELVNDRFLDALLDGIAVRNESTAASVYRFLRILLKNGLEMESGNFGTLSKMKEYPAIEKTLILYTPEQMERFLSAVKRDTASHYLEIAMALFCGLKPGEILALRYGNFDPKEGTVVVNELHTRNYHPANESVWAPRYYNRELRSKSHYRTLPVPEFLFREIEVRKKLNKHILQKYPESKDVKYALCLGPYGKVKTLPTINTRLKKITLENQLPRISLGDLRYMYLADLIKKEKDIKKIMEYLGYTNPYRTLNICQEIAEIQGEPSVTDFVFPEFF